MDFNKKKCLELMKESEKLSQEGKFLWDSDKVKYEELSQYLVLLSDEIFWNSRKKYLQIVESFVRKSINVDEFMQQFGQLRRLNLDALEMRKKI